MITGQIARSRFSKYLVATIFAVHLAACVDDENGEISAIAGSENIVSLASAVVVSGSVGDGPVTGATISVYGSTGRLVGSTITDNTASFRYTLNVESEEYPLLFEVSGGVDLVTGSVPDFQMLSVMMDPSNNQVNINPFSTLIVKSAQSLPGGVTSGNVNSARRLVADNLGFGLDANVIPDPITDVISASNVSNLVKASEALGEMVRRTRDRITEAGSALSGDDVMSAIAADMTDGLLDGVGAQGTDARISAVANVVSGQVLVEAMSNNLKVGGVIATGVIDQAIAITNPQISTSQLTGGVRITQGMLNQVRVALTATQVLDASDLVTNIANTVGVIAADALPEDVEAVLPADSSTLLDYAVVLSPSAEDVQISAINQVVSTGGASLDVNAEPVITGSPAGSVVAGSGYVFQPDASDADGDVLSFSVTNRPGWASFNSTTGRFNGTPSDSDVGTYTNIVISVSDGTDTASLPAFSIGVNELVVPNMAPVISGSPAGSVVAESGYMFQPDASDADNDALSFNIANQPGWASFNTSSGRLSGTPGNGDAGTYRNIVISVTDGTDTVSLPAFSIRVNELVVPNAAPVISGSPAGSVVAGSSYVFQPGASDADNDALSFSIANQPGWASFNAGSGRLSGTPGNGDAGTYRNIVISVTDGTESASLAPFSLTVEAVNTAPIITGSPDGSVEAGGSYIFQPAASDADNDALSFSITNQPGWASFNTSTGRLSGAPAGADVGTYSNIVISVTDGDASVSLESFGIQVVAAQVQTGSFTLNWTAPVTRDDGSPLSLADINGFRVYYGETSGSYAASIDIPDGTATSTTVSDIPAGEYYIVMTTYDVDSLESGHSSEVLKTAQ